MAKKITNPQILAIRSAAEQDPALGRVWVGLDVGLKSTSVCVLGAEGQVVHLSCCRFRGHRDKVFLELEDGDATTEVQPRVQA